MDRGRGSDNIEIDSRFFFWYTEKGGKKKSKVKK